MKYIANFTKSRKTHIGSSDMPALIQHPEKMESIAGYGRTAYTVYQEKTGEIQREPAGLPAKIGSFLEPLILSEAITELTDAKTAEKFLYGYTRCENERTENGYPLAESTQNTDWLHHTEATNAHSVSHADCINISDPDNAILIEAKMSGFWAAKRKDDIYKGYDFELKGHQGIPLGHYYQVHHQVATYQDVYGITIKQAYVALISDGKFNMWEIKIDKKVCQRIIELCSLMKKCIDEKKPPRNLAMNQDDIKAMYKKTNEDFIIISGDDLEKAKIARQTAKEATEQLKAWKQKKDDAESALAIMLKDSDSLQGIIDGELTPLAVWQHRKESERIMGLSEIKKDERLYNYVKKNGLIKVSEASRSLKVK